MGVAARLRLTLNAGRLYLISLKLEARTIYDFEIHWETGSLVTLAFFLCVILLP